MYDIMCVYLPAQSDRTVWVILIFNPGSAQQFLSYPNLYGVKKNIFVQFCKEKFSGVTLIPATVLSLLALQFTIQTFS